MPYTSEHFLVICPNEIALKNYNIDKEQDCHICCWEETLSSVFVLRIFFRQGVFVALQRAQRFTIFPKVEVAGLRAFKQNFLGDLPMRFALLGFWICHPVGSLFCASWWGPLFSSSLVPLGLRFWLLPLLGFVTLGFCLPVRHLLHSCSFTYILLPDLSEHIHPCCALAYLARPAQTFLPRLTVI